MTEEIKKQERAISIYEKLSNARIQFHSIPLKKSGENKYAGYKYFELGDFVVESIKALHSNGLSAFISYGRDEAILELHEFDGDGVIRITSPMSSASLKGCHDVQNLGAVETYIRRYLWVALMEVVENDVLDSSAPLKENTNASQEEIDRINNLPVITDEGYKEENEKLLTDEEKVLNAAKDVGVEKELVYKWQSEHARKPSWKIVASRINTFKREITAFADAQNFK